MGVLTCTICGTPYDAKRRHSRAKTCSLSCSQELERRRMRRWYDANKEWKKEYDRNYRRKRAQDRNGANSPRGGSAFSNKNNAVSRESEGRSSLS